MSSVNKVADKDASSVQPHGCWADLLLALAIYWFSTIVVLVGALAGPYFLPFSDKYHDGSEGPALLTWDGKLYRQIAAEGYSYIPGRRCNAAFFPVYPLASRFVSAVTRLPIEISLLLVSHISLILALLMLLRYLRLQFSEGPRRIWYFSLTSAAFFPTTFFWRMAYSESTFLLLAVLTLYGIARRWSPIWIALVVGLATAARPVGVVLLLPLISYVWRESATFKKSAINGMLYVPVACSGFILFTAFLWSEFDEPFAWIKSQQMWRNRPDVEIFEKGLALATLEPVWSSYLPSAACYWNPGGQPDFALFSIRFWNPIYFVAATVLLGIGIWHNWLNSDETIAGICLLLVPYLSRGYEMCMESQGRFVGVVFPMYLVLGQLLARLPAPVASVILALSGLMMAIHMATIATGYIVI